MGQLPNTTLAALSVAAACHAALATAAPERVDNFLLLDAQGQAHELYYHGDATAIVLLSHSSACQASAADAVAVSELAGKRADVRAFLLASSPADDRATLAANGAALELTAPVLDDDTQIIGEALGITRSGEALVIDPSSWTVAYRGGASAVGAAVDALTAGSEPPASAPISGCDVAFPARNADHARISYADTIAPLLKDNCTACHAEGGIAPWAMTSYTMVRGFAPMIREVVRTKRMPPWQADPHVGQWQGDRSMSIEETQTLVHWIEAGAPRGDGPDPLEDLAPLSSEWPLGEPDLVIDIPGFEVPASGVVDYQFPYVKNELDHGVWITAATVLPGDRSVVHHVLAGSVEGEEPPGREDSVMDNYIIGYAPGAESVEMPAGTGVYVAPGGYYTFQMHYTPTGRAVVDESHMGLYLSETKPENFMRHQVIVSPAIEIPPNAAAHEEAAYYEFHADAQIHTLFPHAHYRGRASRFEVLYPDGRLETVLSVPHYDFNWQRGYEPVEPLVVPAGSRLIHRTVYDNSAQNPANPDPERTVPWGLQSWDEMLYGAFSYSWVDETTAAPIHDPLLADVTQYVGFLDKNMDGKVSWREMPPRLKKRLVQGFKMVDTNGDGGLDIEEFVAMQRQRETAGAD